MDERGIVDQSALRMREGTFAAGVWLSYVVVAASALYVALTWDRPHRLAISILYGVGLAGAVTISRLPRERIVRSAWREQFFMAWSVLDLALIVASVALDGGTSSPLALVLFVPVVFAAMSYPLASVLIVGLLTMVGYLGLALVMGGAPWSYEALFTAMLFCTGAMSAWQARNHDHQHQALMDVSRADPLTGCLNRRGFEERAVAEIATAARNARQGAVLVLDVDRFKDVNDRLGHAAGDELLRWIVGTVSLSLRPADAIGRIGGDEFGVLLADAEPGEALEAAARLAEQLDRRQRVLDRRGDLPAGRRRVRGADARGRRAAVRLARRPARRPRHRRRGASELGGGARARGGHAHERDARALARGRRAGRRDRRRARLGGADARRAADRGDAARRRQGDDPRTDPREARPAERRGARGRCRGTASPAPSSSGASTASA